MQFRRITPANLYSAMDGANGYYNGNIRFVAAPRWTTGTTLSVRLRVAGSRLMGAKVNVQYDGSERRSVAACWHAHRDFFASLFLVVPDALVITGIARYDGAAGFLDKFPETGRVNVGTMANQVWASQSCDCHTMDIDGPIVDKLQAKL